MSGTALVSADSRSVLTPWKMGALGVLSQSKLICTAVGAKAGVGVNARRNVWPPPAPIVTAALGPPIT